MKIVINGCYGGFGLSDTALEMYNELSGSTIEYCHDMARNDPFLIQVVETMGDNANSWTSELRIVEIPDDVQWEIDEHDGLESIHEVHRVWS